MKSQTLIKRNKFWRTVENTARSTESHYDTKSSYEFYKQGNFNTQRFNENYKTKPEYGTIKVPEEFSSKFLSKFISEGSKSSKNGASNKMKMPLNLATLHALGILRHKQRQKQELEQQKQEKNKKLLRSKVNRVIINNRLLK